MDILNVGEFIDVVFDMLVVFVKGEVYVDYWVCEIEWI